MPKTKTDKPAKPHEKPPFASNSVLIKWLLDNDLRLYIDGLRASKIRKLAEAEISQQLGPMRIPASRFRKLAVDHRQFHRRKGKRSRATLLSEKQWVRLGRAVTKARDLMAKHGIESTLKRATRVTQLFEACNETTMRNINHPFRFWEHHHAETSKTHQADPPQTDESPRSSD